MKHTPGERLAVAASTLALSAVSAFGWIACPAVAQTNYPTRQITVVMPYAAGGPTDVAVRAVAKRMSEELKQAVVVDNKPGGGAIIGSQLVANAKPDGYTLLAAVVASLVTNPLLQAKPPYDPNTAFEPISLIAANPLILVASKASGLKSFAEFLRKAKEQPGQMAIASYGMGTPSHLAIELLKTTAGIDVIHVPYNGSAPAMIDLRGGRVPTMMDILPSHVKTIESGEVVGLALGQHSRSALAASVPTFGETGLQDFEALTWFGFVAPAGTPRDVIDRLNAAMKVALTDASTLQVLKTLGMEARPTSPQEFRDLIKADYLKWSSVIKIANIPKQ